MYKYNLQNNFVLVKGIKVIVLSIYRYFSCVFLLKYSESDLLRKKNICFVQIRLDTNVVFLISNSQVYKLIQLKFSFIHVRKEWSYNGTRKFT